MTILLLVSAYEPVRILSDEHCNIARDIARTIPRTFWVQWGEPSSVGSGRYRLQEIVADLRIFPCKLFTAECDDKCCVLTLRCIVIDITSAESLEEKSNDGEKVNVMTHPVSGMVHSASRKLNRHGTSNSSSLPRGRYRAGRAPTIPGRRLLSLVHLLPQQRHLQSWMRCSESQKAPSPTHF
jgi:hypothetical protein